MGVEYSCCSGGNKDNVSLKINNDDQPSENTNWDIDDTKLDLGGLNIDAKGSNDN